jgi:Na+-driven multidrug efflux pump
LLSKRINSGGSIKIIFNGKFLSLLVNSAVSWLFVFYFLQLGVLLYLDRCG